MNEDLRKWFSQKWVRMDTKGNIKGDCAREDGEGKPKCLPLAKARSMDKEDRAVAARRKRREDPVADRAGKGGKPVNVATEEYLQEKNVPTNPTLWARAKTLARSKFDVYPSAYANGWAAKWYKGKGGGWKSIQEGKQMKSLQDIVEGVVVSADFKVDQQGRKYRAKRKMMNPVKDDAQESSVVSSIQKFVDRQYNEEVEQMNEGGINDLPSRGMFGTDTKGHYGVYRNSGPGDTKLKIVSKHKTIDSASKQVDKLRKKSGKDDHYYGHLSAHQPEQGKIPKDFHEEVDQIDEISRELAHSYFKQRYAQTGATRQDKPKGMPRATHDKRLQGMNRAMKRLTTRLILPKGVDPSEGGKYTADSVQHDDQNTIVEVKLSAAVRLQKAFQKAKEDRERQQRLAQPFVDKVFGKKDEKKSVAEAKDPREYDYEGDMAKTQLRSIIANSQSVHDMLKDTTNLAEWVQSKITKAEDYISTVADYMTAEMSEQYVGTGDSKDMQRAVDKARMVAKSSMMKGIHGDTYQDKTTPDHDETDVKVTPNDKGGYSASLKLTPRAKPQAATNEAKEDDDDYSKHHKLDDDSGVEADQHIHVQLKKAIDSTMKPYEVTFKDGKKHSVSSPVAKRIVGAVDKLKPEHRKDVHDELHKSYDSLMGVHKMIVGK